MKRSRFTKEQIIGVLTEHQAGLGTKQLCRNHGISLATFYEWRSKYGGVLESYVTKKRDKKAALKFMKKALKNRGPVDTITTDGLPSYKAAMSELGSLDRQEIGRWANNRVENLHFPFRRRERVMQRFRRMKSLQKFASVHANVRNQFAAGPFGSAPTATSPTDKPKRSPVPPPWRIGKTFWPKPSNGWGALCLTATSSR